MQRFFIIHLTILLISSTSFAEKNVSTKINAQRREIHRGNVVLARFDRQLTTDEISHGLPPAMLAWQQWVSEDESMTTSPDHVDPLLTTEWGQNSPYNLLCPVIDNQTAPTGCVATAMAQILYYWQDHVAGYNWSQMLTNYTNYWGKQASPQQQTAVAQLMVDCGSAVNMEYTPNGASASIVTAVTGMVNHFGFNQGTRCVYRKYMTYAEWAELLRNELRAGRPVFYGGISSSIGHAFVIDGFNEEGLFHVNWGWNGTSNGWFRFTSLTPINKGTGSGSSKDGYNYNQGMLIDLAPADVLTTKSVSMLYADSLSYAVAADGNDSLTLRGIKNLGSDTIKGYVCLAVCHNGQVISRMNKYGSKYAPNKNLMHIFNPFVVSNLTPGETYELIAQWQDHTSSDWHPIIGPMGNPVGRSFTAVTASQLSWAPIQDGRGRPILLSAEQTTFATGHCAVFSTTWTADDSEWNGWITFALENGEQYQQIYHSGIDVHSGSTDSLLVISEPVTIPAGRYALHVGYYQGNLTDLVWLDVEDSVTVITPQTANNLYYADDYSIADTLLTLSNPNLDVTLNLTLPEGGTKNAIFSGSVGMGVYYDTYPEPKDRLLSLPVRTMRLLYGDTATYHLATDLANNLPEGRYRIMLRCKATGKDSYTVNSSSAPIYVTIQHEKTAIQRVEQKRNNTEKIWQNGHLYILRGNRRYTIGGACMGISKDL